MNSLAYVHVGKFLDIYIFRHLPSSPVKTKLHSWHCNACVERRRCKEQIDEPGRQLGNMTSAVGGGAKKVCSRCRQPNPPIHPHPAYYWMLLLLLNFLANQLHCRSSSSSSRRSSQQALDEWAGGGMDREQSKTVMVQQHLLRGNQAHFLSISGAELQTPSYLTSCPSYRVSMLPTKVFTCRGRTFDYILLCEVHGIPI